MRFVSLASARAFWIQIVGVSLLAVGLSMRGISYLVDTLTAVPHIGTKTLLLKIALGLTAFFLLLYAKRPSLQIETAETRAYIPRKPARKTSFLAWFLLAAFLIFMFFFLRAFGFWKALGL